MSSNPCNYMDCGDYGGADY